MEKFTKTIGSTFSWVVPSNYEQEQKQVIAGAIIERQHPFSLSPTSAWIQAQIADKGRATIPVIFSEKTCDENGAGAHLFTQIAAEISALFASLNIPIEFEVQPRTNEHSIAVNFCGPQPQTGNRTTDMHFISLPQNPSANDCGREIAIYFANLQGPEAASLAQQTSFFYESNTLDLQEAKCLQGVSVLPTTTQCTDQGFLETPFLYDRENYGLSDLAQVECSLTNSTQAFKDCIAQYSNSIYEVLKDQYGARVATALLLSIAKKTLDHGFAAAIARSNASDEQRKILKGACDILVRIVQCSLLASFGGFSFISTATLFALTEAINSKALNSLTQILGQANTAQLMVELIRGNEYAWIALAGAYAGSTVTEIFMNALLKLGDKINPMTSAQRTSYTEFLKEPAQYLPRNILAWGASKIAAYTPTNIQHYGVASMEILKFLDERLANMIENIVNLRMLREYLWRSDEQKVEADIATNLEEVLATNVNDANEIILQPTSIQEPDDQDIK